MIALTGCFGDDEFSDKWASRKDIILAAERCGVPNFQPKKLREGWGPWVPGEDPDAGPKTKCIVKTLHEQKLMVTY